MNISMYTVYAVKHFESPLDSFRHFYEKGVRYADIVDDELNEYPLDIYCCNLNEAGIKPDYLVSMVNIANNNDKLCDKNISVVKDYIDQMYKIGIPNIMLAPSVIPTINKDGLKRMQERLICGFAKIAEYAKGAGIKVSIENQSSLNRADSKMNDILDILKCIPELGFVLDTGNFFCVQEDVMKAYDLLRDRVVHVHAKDWQYNEQGNYTAEGISRFDGVALGKGFIPLKSIFEKLKEDGFSGNVNLEVNSGKISLETLDISADFLRSELYV